MLVVVVVVGEAEDGGRGGGAYDDSAGGRGVADLGVEGEGLGEPEGVGVIFVVVAKLLTLEQQAKREGLTQTHKVSCQH